MTQADRQRGPLRIAHVVRSLDVGGQEVILCRLVEALDRDRHAPTVISLMSGGPLEARLRDAGIPVVTLGAREGAHPGLVLELAALAWRLGADVLHTHNFQPFLYAGLASYARPAARLIATAHGFRAWRGWRFPSVSRALFDRASAIVAVTPELSGYLRERGVPEATLRVIVNGVDTEVFRPASTNSERSASRAALGVSPDEIVIGSVGRLSPEKDPENLVRAMERVVAREPRARLVMAGDGPLRPDLEALVRDRRLRAHVRLIGERADVLCFLRALDVFCLPSQTEGTSISLLEAMACALPIVATAVGGTPSVAAHGEAATLVERGDPEAFGDAILATLADPEGARRRGARARSVVEQRFSLRGMADGYGRLYDAICAISRPDLSR